MRKRIILSLSLVSAGIILFMMNMTSPTSAGPFGVLVLFLAFYLLILGVVAVLFELFLRMSGKRRELSSRDCVYAAIVSFGPVFLILSLKSFGKISIISIILSLLIVLLGCFFVSKKFNVVK